MVAVPLAVAAETVTVAALGFDRRTTKRAAAVPVSPSPTEASATLSFGLAVASVIVPVRVSPPAAMVALKAPLRWRVKVSAGSSRRSYLTVTGTVCFVSPALKVSVPLLAS